jgi:hypothetical protein
VAKWSEANLLAVLGFSVLSVLAQSHYYSHFKTVRESILAMMSLPEKVRKDN